MPSKKNNEKEIKTPVKTAPKAPKTAKRLVGVAAADSLNKTVPVKIEYTKIHRLYKKRFTVSRNFLAHAEQEVKKGQTVTIEESRPISKRKAWKVVSVKIEEVKE